MKQQIMKKAKEILLEEYKEKVKSVVDALTAALHNMKIGFSPNLLLSVYNDRVTIWLASEDNPEKMVWASAVNIYPANLGTFPNKLSGISYATSGTFYPDNDDVSGHVWKTLHAGVILKYWDSLLPLFTEACKETEALKEEYYIKMYENEKI